MKPKSLNPRVEGVLSKRVATGEANVVQDTMRKAKVKVNRKALKAVQAINQTRAESGKSGHHRNRTPVVILEWREDHRIGRYAIVGEIHLWPVGADLAEFKPAEGTVSVSYGIGFESPMGESREEIQKEHLGWYTDGSIYGEWLAHESTANINIEQVQFRQSRGELVDARRLAAAQSMLSSMQESIDVILVAAQDPELNPIQSAAQAG